jgi:hypothetical protein
VCLANSAFIAEAGGGAASVAIVLNLLGGGPAVDAGDRAADSEEVRRAGMGEEEEGGRGGVYAKKWFCSRVGVGAPPW